jgi:von Willebrand factor type A domain
MKNARRLRHYQTGLGFVWVLAACSAEPAAPGARGVRATPQGAGAPAPNVFSNAAGTTAAIGGNGGVINSRAPTTPTTPGLPTTPSNPGGSDVCEVARLSANQLIPDMMIVLDRSGSMEDGGRWSPSVSAVRKVTMELGAKINFGLALFPDPDAGGGRNSIFEEDDSVCAPGKIIVPIGANQASAIGKVLDNTRARGGTPTSDTLQGLVQSYATGIPGPDEEQHPKFVLLVTDGAPTCPAGQGMETTQADLDASNAAVDALTAQGVRTYVIGYDTTGAGNEMLASVLDGFAQRGGTGDTKHRSVEDEASLLVELQRITSAVASCTFNLDNAPSRADFVLVKLDGTQINLNDPDGWRLQGDKTIELTGKACDSFKSGGSHGIEALVQCNIVVPN